MSKQEILPPEQSLTQAFGRAPAAPLNDAPLFMRTKPQGLVSEREDFESRQSYIDDGQYRAQWQVFQSAQDWPYLKAKIEADLRYYVYRENMFTSPESVVERVLNDRIYGLARSPRLLKFPQDRLESVTKACRVNPEAFDQLCKEIVHKFIGNTYSGGWDERKSIGTRSISLEDLQTHAPKFYTRMFGDENPSDFKIHSMRTGEEKYVVQQFTDAMTIEDLPELLELYDSQPGIQSRSATLVKGNWNSFAASHEGILYTDYVANLDDTVKESWPEISIDIDFALAHGREVGTVADLIRAGVVEWPAPKSWGKQARKAAFALVSSGAREDRAYESKMENIRRQIIEAPQDAPALENLAL